MKKHSKQLTFTEILPEDDDSITRLEKTLAARRAALAPYAQELEDIEAQLLPVRPA